MTATQRIYEALMRRTPEADSELPAETMDAVPDNAVRLVGATALQSSGDQTVSASTVLPWLFHALGVPSALAGLLVPIRESGSMLPQAMLTPVVVRVTHRKWVFVTGALVQGTSVAAMALVAATAEGLVAGVLLLLALAVFSLGRSLCSIASKDVQGRTIPKGERGQITGLATTAAGIVAITLGLALRTFGGADLGATQLAWLLAAGASLWIFAAVVYARVREPSGHTTQQSAPSPIGADEPRGWWSGMVTLLRDDAPFRRFVIVRSLLLVSALSPPFIVTMAVASGAPGGLGAFVVSAGLSALVGGPIFGRLADRSSRAVMASGAGLASAILIVFVVVTTLPDFEGASAWGTVVFIASYFALTLIHTGVRVGRKTYLVDMAEGDQRTTYVAVSNTAMGLILLATGAVSAALSTLGVEWALVFLAALGLLGVRAAIRLPEVSAGSS